MAMDNTYVVHKLYSVLTEAGLKQNREKFSMEEAGHRNYSVDIGSSYGEVAIRIIDDGKPVQIIRVFSLIQLDQSIMLMLDNISRKRQAIAHWTADDSIVCTCSFSGIGECKFPHPPFLSKSEENGVIG